jgi:hypothetical protein
MGAALLFPKQNYNVLSPNFHIHVSVSDFFFNIFSGLVCLFGCSKIGTRPHSFISVNTEIGTRHLYWILTVPSFAMNVRLALVRSGYADKGQVRQVKRGYSERVHICRSEVRLASSVMQISQKCSCLLIARSGLPVYMFA